MSTGNDVYNAASGGVTVDYASASNTVTVDFTGPVDIRTAQDDINLNDFIGADSVTAHHP